MFYLLIAAANKITDANLAPISGIVFSGMKNTYLLGLKNVLFNTLVSYKQELRKVSIYLNRRKNFC